jgi:hypothetical protein
MLFVLLFACSCNNSGKKDPNMAKDDTARRREPFVIEISTTKISKADIPPGISFKGDFVEGYRWNDNLGENIFFISWVAPYDHKDKFGDDAQSAELYAAQYVMKEKGGVYEMLWEDKDAEKDCGFDITCASIDSSTTITDLDKNGTAETKWQYALACRSDVSPSFMKLVLHEGSNSWSLQGMRWLASDPAMVYDITEQNADLEKLPPEKDEYKKILQSFGRYETERSFATAPPSFLSFARKEWLKYSKEKIPD